MGYECGKNMYILDSYYVGSPECAVTMRTFNFNDLQYERITGECLFGIFSSSGSFSNQGNCAGQSRGQFDWEIPK